MKLYKKYFVMMGLVWLGSLGLFLATHILLVAPQNARKLKATERLGEKEQMYRSAVEASKEETKVRLTMEVEELRSKLSDFVVETAGSASMTFDIGQLASERNIEPFSVKAYDQKKLSQELDCKYIDEDKIQVKFEGDFNQFAMFLNALERHRPVVFVDSFRIDRAQKQDAGHKVDMDLSVFVQKRQDS